MIKAGVQSTIEKASSFTGRSEFVKNAFRKSGKNASHWVDAGLGILVQKLHHFSSVLHKFTAQETISQKYLTDDIYLRTKCVT